MQPLQSRLDDTKEMLRAISALTDEGLKFSRHTRYQLKIDDLNYYPDTGKIFRDGDTKAWEQRGLEILLKFLLELRIKKAAQKSLPGRNSQSPPELVLVTPKTAD